VVDLDIRHLREREDHAATQGFFGGLLIGALLGVVLALVFAPRRGEETRAAVAHSAVDLKDKTVGLVHKGAGQDVPEDRTGGEAAIEREIGGDPEDEDASPA